MDQKCCHGQVYAEAHPWISSTCVPTKGNMQFSALACEEHQNKTAHRSATLRSPVLFHKRKATAMRPQMKDATSILTKKTTLRMLSSAPQYSHNMVTLQQSFPKWVQTEFTECPILQLTNPYVVCGPMKKNWSSFLPPPSFLPRILSGLAYADMVLLAASNTNPCNWNTDALTITYS